MSYPQHEQQPTSPPAEHTVDWIQTETLQDTVPPWQHRAPSRRRWWIAGGIAAAILGGGGIATAVLAAESDNPPRDPSRYDGVFEEPERQLTTLQQARMDCAPASPDIQLGDEGRSITIVGAGHFSGADIEDAACILTAVDTPDSVIARIDSTRALDGMQDAEWDGYTATWTYHPDDGLNLIIEQTS